MKKTYKLTIIQLISGIVFLSLIIAFEREKEKATWFFAILSFSFFSVFSIMANAKKIMKE